MDLRNVADVGLELGVPVDRGLQRRRELRVAGQRAVGQHPAEAAVFAQLLPSFPLQQEASSFPEQQEATSFPSFVLDFVCMQASVCLCDAELVPVAVLSQQEHFVSGVAFSGVDGAGVAVCAHEAIERIRKKAINLNFMTHISVYVKFWGALLRARSSSLIA